ncbi:MAG: hypothetical protein NPINA01_25810 [Nitrospinaceae bacterium]|nr:MAG: hypothetical protein NPINA01_25810 [Nitrospinaceae bacterium]
MWDLQMDTRPIELALKVFTNPKDTFKSLTEKKDSKEYVISTLEFCNNLLLGNKVFYDANPNKDRKDTIGTLKEMIKKKFADNELNKLFDEKFQPLGLDDEKKAVIESGDQTIDLMPIVFSEKENLLKIIKKFDMYQGGRGLDDPNENDFFNYLKNNNDPLSYENVQDKYNHKITGYRFFRSLLCQSDDKYFRLRKSYNSGQLNYEELKILFTIFRVNFSSERCTERMNQPNSPATHYYPTPERRRIFQQIGSKIFAGRNYEQLINLDGYLSEALPKEGKTYVKSQIITPLALYFLLGNDNDMEIKTPLDLLRMSLISSQESMHIRNIKSGMKLFCALESESDRKKCINDILDILGGRELGRKEDIETLIGGFLFPSICAAYGNFLPGLLSLWHTVKFIERERSKTRQAAIMLADPLYLELTKPKLATRFVDIFGEAGNLAL